MFRGQPFSVVRPHEFDEGIAVRSEFTRRHSPFRPWLSRVFVEAHGVPSGRADAVAADDHDILEPWCGGQRPHRYERPKPYCEPANSHDETIPQAAGVIGLIK